jgi:hypothetical protein
MLQIGVRFPAGPARPHDALPGRKCAVYDIDSGAFLPCEIVTVTAGADDIVTATVKLHVSEITVGDGDG